jgi:hypothetical protein
MSFMPSSQSGRREEGKGWGRKEEGEGRTREKEKVA